ncbi:unnamed protein product [Tilletia controversa]|nr:unnamed protein product [Tilletia controversa]
MSDELAPVLVAPAASTRFPALVAHLMPFHIDYDGPAPVNSFLVFDVEHSTDSHQPVLTSAFRGRKLYGYPLQLPIGWSAAVVLKPTPAEKETAYTRKQRAIAQSRNAEERERRKNERLEVKRAELEEKRAQVKKDRQQARTARQAEKAAEREEKRLARIAVKAEASSSRAKGESGASDANLEQDGFEEEDEEEDEDDEDLLDDLRYLPGAIDDSADEYNPVGMSVGGVQEIEEDEEEEGRAKKKARPRPRAKLAGAGGPRSALSTGGLTASLSSENPHGLQPPPPPHQSLSAISRFQQAVVANAPPSFSMDDDDDDEDEQEGNGADGYAAQDPTALDPASNANDMILPSDHQRERGDILDHNIVAIHATVDVEMDALAIAAARAAQTAADNEELRAAADQSAQEADALGEEDYGLPPAETSSAAAVRELPGTPGEDDVEEEGTASTSAYFGRGGGSLVGGGLFDALRRKPSQGSAGPSSAPAPAPAPATAAPRTGRSTIAIPVPSSSSTSPFAGLTTRSSPRRPDRAGPSAQQPSAVAGSPESVRVSSRLQGKKSEESLADSAPRRQEGTKRGARVGTQSGPAVTAEAAAVVIPGSDDEDGGDAAAATGLGAESEAEAEEEASENQSPTRRSSRLQSHESPVKKEAKTTKKAKDTVVYGTGEAAAAARRAREVELSRRKSGRTAALPTRFKDDAVEFPTSASSKSLRSAAASSSSKSGSGTLKRAASSGSLASKAASQGASAMRQWLSGGGAKTAGGGGGGSKKAGSSPSKRGAAARGEVDEEEEEVVVVRSSAKRRASSASLRRSSTRKVQRGGDDDEEEEEEEEDKEDEEEQDWEKESPSQRSKRLSAASLEVVVHTSDRALLEKETKAGGWRRSESVSPRKAASSSKATTSKAAAAATPQPRPRQRVVTAVTSSGRVAVRPARFSPEPEPVPRKSAKRAVVTGPKRGEEEEEEDSSEDDDEGDDGEDELGVRGAGAGTGAAKTKYRKRVWTKRWTFEERMDVMLGETHVSNSGSHTRVTRGHNNSDVLEGVVKLRVAGRLSTANPHPSPPASASASASSSVGPTPTAAELEREREAALAKAVGSSGIVLWNADGPLDEGDDGVVRTVHELLGVWALVHEY